jgi:DNA-binding response OmpR family regulator
LLTLNNVLPYGVLILDYEPSRFFKTLPQLQQHFSKVLLSDAITSFESHLLSNALDVVLIRLDYTHTDTIGYIKELKKQFKNDIKFVLFKEPPIEDFVLEIALEAGADAVIPFQHKSAILIPFLRNLLRRKNKLQRIMPAQDFIMDDERFEVRYNNLPIVLPKKEFNLLKTLVEHPDKIFTKIELAELIWNDQSIAQKRTIDVHVYNIRQAIHKLIIKSYKGKGYRYNLNFISAKPT